MPQKEWSAIYHSEVFNDLQALSMVDATRVIRVIESSLLLDPISVGISVESVLKDSRLFKTDEFHIIYQVDTKCAQVYVLAIRHESGLAGSRGQKAKTHMKVG